MKQRKRDGRVSLRVIKFALQVVLVGGGQFRAITASGSATGSVATGSDTI